jgi:hypothetical protein
MSSSGQFREILPSAGLTVRNQADIENRQFNAPKTAVFLPGLAREGGKRPGFTDTTEEYRDTRTGWLGARPLQPKRLDVDGCRPAAPQLARVGFHSYSEPHLSTDNELVRDVLLAVLASLAKLERQKISERTKAGLERARARGKRLGRAPFSARDRERLRMVLDAGRTWYAASGATGIPYSTVKKHARALGYSPPARHRASVG